MHQILGMQQVFCMDRDSDTICGQLIVVWNIEYIVHVCVYETLIISYV